MFQLLANKWWLFALRGLVAIVFGIVAFVRPELALAALVALYGTFALVDGLVSLGACFLFSGTKLVWWLLFEGLMGIAAGILSFALPGATAVALLSLLGIWLIASGVVRIMLSIEMRKVVDGAWLGALAGVCSLIAGALTLFRPLQTAVAWMWLMGCYAVIFGIVMFALGMNLRRLSGPNQVAN